MVALVTGASGGIGRAAALTLARDGFDVGAHYHSNRGAALGLAEEISSLGRRSVALCADLRDHAQAAAMVEDARICLGEVDVLVCAAGIAEQKLFTDITPEMWNQMLSVNLTGTFNSCRAVVPGMIARGRGSIITISSVWGQTGASCEVHYSAAKAGIIGMTKALAKELAPSGIRVNCVAPGAIDTSMNAHLDECAMADIIERIPLGRLGQPEDVAGAVAFLASERAAFITGEVISVAGGFQ